MICVKNIDSFSHETKKLTLKREVTLFFSPGCLNSKLLLSKSSSSLLQQWNSRDVPTICPLLHVLCQCTCDCGSTTPVAFLVLPASKDLCCACIKTFYGKQKFLLCSGPRSSRLHQTCLSLSDTEYYN